MASQEQFYRPDESAGAPGDQGRRMTGAMKDRAREAREKTQEKAYQTGEKAQEGKEKTKGVFQQTGEKVKHVAGSAADTVKQTLGVGQQRRQDDDPNRCSDDPYLGGRTDEQDVIDPATGTRRPSAT